MYAAAATPQFVSTPSGMLPLTAATTNISPTAAAAATAGQMLDYTSAASAYGSAASATGECGF